MFLTVKNCNDIIFQVGKIPLVLGGLRNPWSNCMGTHPGSNINNSMIIYKTTNLITGMSYIGKATRNIKSYLGSGIHIQAAIRKYGKENFSKEILEVCESLEHLAEREKYWIHFYNAVTDPMFYNISAGGEGGDPYTNNPNKENMRIVNGNSTRGRRWIRNMNTNQYRFVKDSEFQELLASGEWIRSNAPNRVKQKKSVTWIHKETSGKLINTIDLPKYLEVGWVKGRPPRNPEWNENNRRSQLKAPY